MSRMGMTMNNYWKCCCTPQREKPRRRDNFKQATLQESIRVTQYVTFTGHTLNLLETFFDGAFKLVVLEAFTTDGAEGDNNGETKKWNEESEFSQGTRVSEIITISNSLPQS